MGLFRKKDKHFELAVEALETQNCSEALEQFKQVAPSSKEYNRVQTHIVTCMRELGMYEEGILHFESISCTNPYYDQAIADLIGIYVNLGRYDEALLWSERVSPDDKLYYIIALINRVTVFANSNNEPVYGEKVKETMRMMDRADNGNPYYPTLLSQFIVVLSDYELFVDLLGYSESLLEFQPSDNSGLYFKGEAMYELDRLQEALIVLDKVHPLCDEYIDAVYLKVLIYEKMENENKAKECIDEVYSMEHSLVNAITTATGEGEEICSHQGKAPRKRKATLA